MQIYKILCLLFLYNNIFIESWHAYDIYSKPNEECSKLYNNTEIPKIIHTGNKYRLWPDLIVNKKINYGKSLYGFYEAIDILWNHQNPKKERCKDQRYIISSGWQWGFGSTVHIESTAFALALELNRIYLPNPDGGVKGNKNDNSWQTHYTSFCKNQNIHSYDCYYEPWSSCSISDIIGYDNITLTQLTKFIPVYNDDQFITDKNGKLLLINSNININELNDKVKVFILLHTGRNKESARFIPTIFKPILKCSPVSTNKYYLWWRAISSTYYLRPNENTLRYLKSFTPLVYNETQGMHIRHGDKDSEMKLIPFSNFSNTIELLYHNGIIKKYLNQHYNAISTTTTNNNSKSNIIGKDNINNFQSIKNNKKRKKKKIPIFFGTENPQVIGDAIQWSQKSSHFRIIYTQLFDRYEVTARLSYKDTKLFREVIHHDLEFISILLNLEYILKCDIWICTLASNTCRLIDELRTTIAGKANYPFIDLSVETCLHPPCVANDFDISKF